MKFSLRKKITIAIAVICVLFGSAMGVGTFFYLSNTLVNQKINSISQLSAEQVHESTQIIKNDQLFAKMLGTRTRVKEFLADRTEARRSELLGIFNDYAKEDEKYLALYLLDENGTCLISTDSRFVGENYSFRDYFKDAKDGKASVDIFIGKTSKQFGYYYAHPVLDTKGGFIGVMMVKVDSASMDQAILNSEISEDSSIMLADENGVIVSSNVPDRFLKSLGALNTTEKEKIVKTEKFLDKDISPIQYEDAQKIIREYKTPQTVKIYDAVDSEEEILNVTKVGDFPFYLVVEVGLEDIADDVFGLTMILVSSILIGLILMSFVIYKIVSVVIRPLDELKTFAQNISSGVFSEKIEIKTKDEFADLSESFNKMADNLADLYENLDNKVKERTEEMKKSEEQLKKALEESERVNKLMVGRELEMVELKKEIMDLKNKK